MNPITITALILFAATYILMMAFQKIRPYVAIGSALIFIALGTIASASPDLFGSGFFNVGESTYSYGVAQALGEIDWNVLMMIAGTMGTVYLFIESKMPQLMSDILISKMPNIKWAIVCLSLFAGIVSAFVDNVATVLMIAPVALAFCKTSPLFRQSFALRYPRISRVRQRSLAIRRRFFLQNPLTLIFRTSSLTAESPVCSGSLRPVHSSAHS